MACLSFFVSLVCQPGGRARFLPRSRSHEDPSSTDPVTASAGSAAEPAPVVKPPDHRRKPSLSPPTSPSSSSKLEASPHTLEAPSPSFEAPPPSFEAPPPSFEAPSPSFEAPSPSFEAPSPSFEAPPPSFEAPPPSCEAPPPSLAPPPQPSGHVYVVRCDSSDSLSATESSALLRDEEKSNSLSSLCLYYADEDIPNGGKVWHQQRSLFERVIMGCFVAVSLTPETRVLFEHVVTGIFVTVSLTPETHSLFWENCHGYFCGLSLTPETHSLFWEYCHG